MLPHDPIANRQARAPTPCSGRPRRIERVEYARQAHANPGPVSLTITCSALLVYETAVSRIAVTLPILHIRTSAAAAMACAAVVQQMLHHLAAAGRDSGPALAGSRITPPPITSSCTPPLRQRPLAGPLPVSSSSNAHLHRLVASARNRPPELHQPPHRIASSSAPPPQSCLRPCASCASPLELSAISSAKPSTAVKGLFSACATPPASCPRPGKLFRAQQPLRS